MDITDTDGKIVGVKTETMAHVADMLATWMDPADWLPEMFRTLGALPVRMKRCQVLRGEARTQRVPL